MIGSLRGQGLSLFAHWHGNAYTRFCPFDNNVIFEKKKNKKAVLFKLESKRFLFKTDFY